MADSGSNEQDESSGTQVGSVHIGPIKYHFLKFAIYFVVGLSIWPYPLLLYIYPSIRRLSKNLAKLSRRALGTIRDEYETDYEEGESEN